MNKEQAFFLQVLNDYIHEEVTEVSDLLDWVTVYKIAIIHRMTGIIWSQCRKYFNDNPDLSSIGNNMMRNAFSIVSHNLKLLECYKVFKSILCENNIPFILIKGPFVSNFYPDSELRAMSDIDIMVHPSDIEKIQKYLIPAQFEVLQWSSDEWKFQREDCLFELHEHLIRTNEDSDPYRVSFFNKFWSYAKPGINGILSLNPDFHFVYLIEHISKHFRSSGLGFQHFFDLAVMVCRNDGTLHWDNIQSISEEIGLFKFTRSCLSLCERWFGVESPFGSAQISDQLFDEITAKIFQNGVFGFSNTENKSNRVAQQKRESKASICLIKLRAMHSLLFPSYKNLITSEKYRYLRGRPYLLPYAWVKRIINTSNKKTKAEGISSILRISKDKIMHTEQQWKELGL